MASLVEFAPVPAITGTRLLTCVTTWRMTAQCSSTVSVADSPVVPTATIASVPFSIWKSINVFRQSPSNEPSFRIGVTSATILPLNMFARLQKLNRYVTLPATR